MKGVATVAWVMTALMVTMAAGAVDLEKQRNIELNGEPGDFTFAPEAVLSDTFAGELTAASPVWDRIYGCNVSPACSATCGDSPNNGQYYQVIPIQVTAEEVLEAAVTASAIDDTVMTLYCDPFNPAAPLSNVVAYDDDDGAGTWSAFTPADGITLQPGQTYYLVVSSFASAATGTFTVSFTSATVHVVPVELQAFTAE